MQSTYGGLLLSAHKSGLVSMARAFRYVNEHAEKRTERHVVYWTFVYKSKILTNRREVGGVCFTERLDPGRMDARSSIMMWMHFLTVMLLFTVRE